MKKFHVKAFAESMRFMFSYNWRLNKRIFGASVIETIFNVVEPLMYIVLPKYIIDGFVNKKGFWEMAADILFLIGIIGLVRLLRILVQPYINMSVNIGDVNTALDYLKDYTYMDYGKLEDDEIRTLQARVSTNIRANSFVYSDLSGLVSSVCLVITYASIMMALNPFIVLAIFVSCILSYYLDRKKKQVQYQWEIDSTPSQRRLSYLFDIMLNFDYAKEMRMNQASNWVKGKYSKELSHYQKHLKAFTRRQMLLSIGANLINALLSGFLYGYLAYMVIRGSVSVGNFAVYVATILSFSGAFNSVISGVNRLKAFIQYVDDYKNYRQLTIPSYSSAKIPLKEVLSPDSSFCIEFHNVSFHYPKTSNEVLKNISFTIHSGERLAVIGLNGAGKTTLIKLICRLYTPTQGKITFNGVDIQEIQYEQYIGFLSAIFQDYQVFSLTVKDNIVLDHEVNEEKLINAVQKSDFEARLNCLPDGLNTYLNKDYLEEGIELSGGEAQKLVIARALYQDTPIIILDEPTASIDAIAEEKLYQTFDRMIGNKTALYISHRLSSTRFCNRILVIDHGEIAEIGTHDTLMAKEGIYFQLFSKQANYYIG